MLVSGCYLGFEPIPNCLIGEMLVIHLDTASIENQRNFVRLLMSNYRTTAGINASS